MEQIGLCEVLLARERRAQEQSRLIAQHGAPVVCLTMNIAGPVKRTKRIAFAFACGLRALLLLPYPVRDRIVIDAPTGCEALLCIDADTDALKTAAMAIEDAGAWGRLYDIDVIGADGEKRSRPAARPCLVCGGPAAACARSRAHGLDAVLEEIGERLDRGAAAQLAAMARRALLGEVYATPKPGLVDRNNTGAHRDMDVPLFERSAASLEPYFAAAARLGLADAGMPALRAAGIAAEQAMLSATGGVNTHRGAIYSMGLLVYGMGRFLAGGGAPLAEAAALAAGETDRLRAACANTPHAALSHGARAYLDYGAPGARGEAEAGFPHAALICARLAAYAHLPESDAAALALCDAMASLEDTNLLHRGGRAALGFVQAAARRIAALPEGKRMAALVRLDTEMIGRNYSPGGSADALSLGLLLKEWEDIWSTIGCSTI